MQPQHTNTVEIKAKSVQPSTECIGMLTMSIKCRLYVYADHERAPSTECIFMHTMSIKYRMYLYSNHEYQVQTVCVSRP